VLGTLEAAPPAPAEPTSRTPPRRRLVGSVVLTLVCVLGWTSSSSIGGSPLHSTNMVENLDQQVLTEEGVQAALGDLHGHLDSVLRDGGTYQAHNWVELAEFRHANAQREQ
jgi:hypothetical protein